MSFSNYLLDIGLLRRNRELRLLYAGQFISFMGTMISYVVLPYQIYQITGSTIILGLLSLVQLVPLLFTALLGGALADRYNRRNLILISEVILSFCCGFLAINAALTQASVWALFIIAFVMAGINGLHRPALESSIQQIVAPEEYKKVAALASFKFSFGMIFGPAVAGLLIDSHGLVITYLIDLGSFIFSLLCLLAMKKMQQPATDEHPCIMTSVQEGMKFALKRQTLMGSYLVDILAMIFAMPNALFPAIAMQFGGAKTLGLLYSAPALGSLIVSFISAWTDRIKHEGRAIALSAALWGLSIVGFGLSNSLYLALFFLFLSGVFDSVSGIFRGAMWNHIIPQNFRGRLAGIEMLSYLSGPKLGDTRAGFMAALIGLGPAIYLGGFFCIAAIGLSCYLLPDFWNYAREENKKS